MEFCLVNYRTINRQPYGLLKAQLLIGFVTRIVRDMCA